MTNERKTESIVRDHFYKFKDEIFIEEQSSDSPNINKLLTLASKKGTGKGFPEFIIRLKKYPDLLIVVECKAESSKHVSNSLNKYSEYAVDGALLYSSYLSKEFDVLSIAVSGESEPSVKVSHYLQLKGETSAISQFSNKLLPPNDYLEGYFKSPQKFRQDYEKLIVFSKNLNEKMHGYKILESDRSLLLSCILIALENRAFLISYKDYPVAEDLAHYLVNTAMMEFKNAKIQVNKLDILTQRFNFITTDTSLSTVDGVLSGIIKDVEDNVSTFIRTHKYFDVLGQLYIEFLRYANSDKGLGIVLTPPHITELMALLAEVNKDSVVYDNCTGTGGFLVSSMNLMIKDAKDDLNIIKNIKQHQLIGVEYQANIFALACSNMFIHQDGKSNILKGSCFDKEIIDQVKSYQPTVGLLNPPYKSDKKKDTEELEFVLSNLDCLKQGGKCVAIVPAAAGQAQKGKVLELKRKILEQHTLEAVLSMPDELFFNSKVGVVSCIMVFTAKRPHPKGKETYFGYYKDDGFRKKKNKGRIDSSELFEKQIKDNWITSYFNRKEIAGFSINRPVVAEDEWCAEAYMETDYSNLKSSEFINKLIDYSTFLFFNRIKDSVSNESVINKDIKLDTTNWTYFNLPVLFDVTSTRDELMDVLAVGTKTPYITSSELNNGVTDYVDEESDFGKNTITANRGGSVGYFFYQPINYLATPVDVRVLSSRFAMNPYTGVFLSTILQKEKYRFNYSRKMGTDRLKNLRIKLPQYEGVPDWDFMENYIKSLPYSASI